ncbi:hypothetical protein B9Z55_014854 [Caenorhabditis nigoni]|uniref:Uncharacterized protein n=1 Tax=Caenorhabditis nigoni TaxID=1611254 RepID=A0A2G5U7K7_9PELO|nr:hypothetical protein B9Z55_014854 [Caenorhabditis nigoni]
MEQGQKDEADRLKRVRVAEREKLIERLTSGLVDQVIYVIVDEEVRKAKIVRKQMIAKDWVFSVTRNRGEDEFYRRFEKSALIETRYKFNAPDDWIRSKRKSLESVLNDKQPTHEWVRNSLFQCPDTSLYVARRHLEDWEPSTGLPEDVKDKLKRKRESFEPVCEEHLLKKKRDEAQLYEEVKKEDLYLKKVTSEADALLDETLRYTAELDRMMADIKSRRVDEL